MANDSDIHSAAEAEDAPVNDNITDTDNATSPSAAFDDYFPSLSTEKIACGTPHASGDAEQKEVLEAEEKEDEQEEEEEEEEEDEQEDSKVGTCNSPPESRTTSPFGHPTFSADVQAYAEEEAAASQRLSRKSAAPEDNYPLLACKYFGERFPHRLRWSHAVNSTHRLKGALSSGAHFLEADVSCGPLILPATPDARQGISNGDEGAGGSRSSRPREQHKAEAKNSIRTKDGESVIMAHYPTQTQSDLSFEDFITAVIKHNKKALASQKAVRAHPGIQSDPALNGANAAPERGRGVHVGRGRLPSFPEPESGDEAQAFVQELNSELDRAQAHGSTLTACVGSRRDIHEVKRLTPKGVKLDFKKTETIAPALEYLRSIDASRHLGGHLWLNADVFQGPGGLMTPFDAKAFVKACAEGLPEAVMSLSWGSSVLSTTRLYTHEMVECMIELCMNPTVPRSIEWAGSATASGAGASTPVQPESEDGATPAEASQESERSAGDCPQGSRQPTTEGASTPSYDVLLAPAAVCRHITFAVAAEYALKSTDSLHRLLKAVPGASLTIFSGLGSLGLTPAYVHDLIKSYGKGHLFLDLKLSKSWRTCSQGGCVVQ
mmetsp:Transcript_9445/g.21106  ORF Transcript_9445/g.21106 Transcript_9445/m.21106 type:complete len:606 (-) Transcript_9445:68-1885(-)